jgi:hypothetical protein
MEEGFEALRLFQRALDKMKVCVHLVRFSESRMCQFESHFFFYFVETFSHAHCLD